MSFIIGGILIVLFLAAIIPAANAINTHKKRVPVSEYAFSSSLIDQDMDSLEKDGTSMPRTSMQNRGSVRISTDRIMTSEDFNKKKKVVYEKELP